MKITARPHFLSGKTTKLEAGWAEEPVWRNIIKWSLTLAGIRTPDVSARRPVTIPTELSMHCSQYKSREHYNQQQTHVSYDTSNSPYAYRIKYSMQKYKFQITFRMTTQPYYGLYYIQQIIRQSKYTLLWEQQTEQQLQ